MKALSHCQVVTTISTGRGCIGSHGAANGHINKQNTERQLLRALWHLRPKICGASMRAAIVIAAGTVMSEPSSGTAARPSQAVASGVRTGAMRAMVMATVHSTGRDAAITVL